MRLLSAPRLVWFRDDLRLADNPALVAAGTHPVAALYILEDGVRPLGGAARWWLHGALTGLREALFGHGVDLLILRGSAERLLPALATEIGAAEVFWNRRYGEAERSIDAMIKTALKGDGIGARSFCGHLLYEPHAVRSQTGGPLRVFTPFWRAARATGEPPAPLPAPDRLFTFNWPRSVLDRAVHLDALALEPRKPNWARGFDGFWQRGEVGAAAALNRFLDGAFEGYAANRDRPDMTSTSRLSPHLRFGEISARTVYHAAMGARESARSAASVKDYDKFTAELGWREFSYHLYFHYPDLRHRNHQAKFDAFPWRYDPDALAAWQRGLTGYPLVDAGMRELWQTGFVHNRVRMVVASFLIKHLMIDWREGEAWFWDTLVDADPANNAASWQWVAGSGADAAPYFRIFNPFSQGEKFDPSGDYVRRHVPEIARLPAPFIHRPWTAPSTMLDKAGVVLGKTYPRPIVDHDMARARALAAFQSLASAAA